MIADERGHRCRRDLRLPGGEGHPALTMWDITQLSPEAAAVMPPGRQATAAKSALRRRRCRRRADPAPVAAARRRAATPAPAPRCPPGGGMATVTQPPRPPAPGLPCPVCAAAGREWPDHGLAYVASVRKCVGAAWPLPGPPRIPPSRWRRCSSTAVNLLMAGANMPLMHGGAPGQPAGEGTGAGSRRPPAAPCRLRPTGARGAPARLNWPRLRLLPPRKAGAGLRSPSPAVVTSAAIVPLTSFSVPPEKVSALIAP